MVRGLLGPSNKHNGLHHPVSCDGAGECWKYSFGGGLSQRPMVAEHSRAHRQISKQRNDVADGLFPVRPTGLFRAASSYRLAFFHQTSRFTASPGLRSIESFRSTTEHWDSALRTNFTVFSTEKSQTLCWSELKVTSCKTESNGANTL